MEAQWGSGGGAQASRAGRCMRAGAMLAGVLGVVGCDPSLLRRFHPGGHHGGDDDSGGTSGSGAGHGGVTGSGGAADPEGAGGNTGTPGVGGNLDVGVGGAAGSVNMGAGGSAGVMAAAWTEVAAPAGLSNFLATDAFAVGPDDIIFAGVVTDDLGAAEARFLRHTASGWAVELTVVPPPGVSLGVGPSVHGTSSHDIWAVAGDAMFHRTPTGWTAIDDGWRQQVADVDPTPGPIQFTRVRAVAINEVWVSEANNVLHRLGAGWTAFNFDVSSTTPGATIAFQFADIWIDAAQDVWIAGGSDVRGSTMDPAFLHHFDGSAWTQIQAGTYRVHSVWRSGPALWLAIPGNLTSDSNGMTVQETLRAYEGTIPTRFGHIAGSNPAEPTSITRLWGRGASDIWGGGSDLVHYDGTEWNLVTGAPAVAHGPGTDNTFVTGDSLSTWIVTPGAQFFRRVE